MTCLRESERVQRKPEWLKHKLPTGPGYEHMKSLLRHYNLVTVCQQARCPNQFECFADGTATFMILGDRCTRNCSYCAVLQHPETKPDPMEPQRVGEAVSVMGLRYAVITSVTRDDLVDGGASHFAKTITAIRQQVQGVKIEILIPDFQGMHTPLKTLLETAPPDVLNHNLETVKRLFPKVRPEADYVQSLKLLNAAKSIKPELPTKSGLMLGLGESPDELEQAMRDLLAYGCDILTLGQYLQPTKAQVPVQRFVTPDEFDALKEKALLLGFKAVAAGPGVRSSYNAGRLYENILQ